MIPLLHTHPLKHVLHEPTVGMVMSNERYNELITAEKELKQYQVKLVLLAFEITENITCSPNETLFRITTNIAAKKGYTCWNVRDANGMFLEVGRTPAALHLENGSRLFIEAVWNTTEEHKNDAM